MFFLFILLNSIFGLLVIDQLSPRFKWIEKIAFSFAIGMGWVTFSMFLFDVLGLSITTGSLWVATVVGLGAILALAIKRKSVLFQKESYSIDNDLFKRFNIAWWVIFILLLMLFLPFAQKGLLLPSMAIDSVNGYDLIAKGIAFEGKIFSSVLEFPYNLDWPRRHHYPLYVPGSFAVAHLFGNTPKWITILFCITNLVGFYALVRRFSSNLAAIFFTLVMFSAPEMLSHLGYSLTNLPQAAVAGAGIMCVIIYIRSYQKDNPAALDKGFLYLGVLLLALNQWARADGVMFSIAAGAMLFIFALQTKKWKVLAWGGVMLAPYLLWNFYLRAHDVVYSNYFLGFEVNMERWSEQWAYIKWFMFSAEFFSITFWALIIVAIANIAIIAFTDKKWNKDNWQLLLATFIAWMVANVLYYQLDNEGHFSMKAYMFSSYKRGLFPFVVLAWLYVSSSYLGRKVFGKIQKMIYPEDILQEDLK